MASLGRSLRVFRSRTKWGVSHLRGSLSRPLRARVPHLDLVNVQHQNVGFDRARVLRGIVLELIIL